MITVFSQLSIQGKAFSPKLASRHLGISMKNATEPGQLMQSGRYKGRPCPDGRAIFDGGDGNLDKLIERLPILSGKLRADGAEDLVLFVFIEYEEQCNWELSVEQIEQLAQAKVPLAVTCSAKGLHQ